MRKTEKRIKYAKRRRRLASLLILLGINVSLNGCGTARELWDEAARLAFGRVNGTEISSETGDPTGQETREGKNPAGREDSTADEGKEPYSGPWDELAVDPVFCPYYGMLDENEQVVYRQAYYNVQEGIPEFEPCRHIDGAALDRIISALYNDQPKLFWLEADYEYRHRAGQVTGVVLHFNELAQDIEYSLLRFEAAAAGILEEAKGLETAQEKERYVHDALLNRVIYDGEAVYNQNAYSALVLGSSVCAGYARAFQYLMTQLEIPCYYCVGTAVSLEDPVAGASDRKTDEETAPESTRPGVSRPGTEEPVLIEEDHAWNIICLDGLYYNVDPTWNDTLLSDHELIYYGYYNRSDEEFLTDHTRSERSQGLPACTGGPSSFEALYGIPAELGVLEAMGLTQEDVIDSLDGYYLRCQELLVANGEGDCKMSLLVSGETVMEEILDAVDNGDYEKGYLTKVVKELRLNGFRFSLSLVAEQLSGEYYLVTQDTTLR